jgi:predicted PurR-regulated permease PerM
MEENKKSMMTETNKLFFMMMAVLVGWVLYQLTPVLMPFLFSALLAYLADPIVDKLEAKKISRSISVSIVFAVLFLLGLIVLFIVLPLLTSQIGALLKRLPDYFLIIQSSVVPWLNSMGLPIESFDANALKQTLAKYWSEVGQVAGGVFNYVTSSGMVVLQWLANIILVPVVTFYLLRDWDLLVARFRELIPRRHLKKFIAMTLECDDMLAAFIRGQLMVMLALATIYTAGLAIIGLELSLLVGIAAGIVSFVPYLGLIVGIGLAGLAAFFQFHEWLPILMVVLVFGVAQVLESVVLTPRFVGERIGLHPVAVIFSVLAGGQLFGFAGVLLALPVAAVIMVLLRHAHQRYLSSQIYS